MQVKQPCQLYKAGLLDPTSVVHMILGQVVDQQVDNEIEAICWRGETAVSQLDVQRPPLTPLDSQRIRPSTVLVQT